MQTLDFAARYEENIRTLLHGYGIYAKYHVFTVHSGAIVPVRHPDPQRLDELSGYERERRKVIANTRALLEGRPASNVLLYGDAGTGKSSTVKAVANAFADRDFVSLMMKKINTANSDLVKRSAPIHSNSFCSSMTSVFHQ